MRMIVFVALGGAVGSTLRYLLAALVQRFSLPGQVPWGTMAVNILGGLVVGLLAGGKGMSPELRHALVVGLLGGFTTFSAFSWETASLACGGHPRCALANLALTVIMTLACTWLGYRLRTSIA